MEAIAQPGKVKSRRVLDAFLAGAPSEAPGIAFFGCVGLEQVFAQARSGVWYYGDNGYLDRSRGTHFRFTRNCFQPEEIQPPDWGRYKAHGIKVRDWQRRGGHIVVVEQSEHFLTLSGAGAGWLGRTVETLREWTDRPLRIRRWSRDKAKAALGLQDDLRGAHALVTWASSAAIEALLAGVPTVVQGQSAAAPMSFYLEEIERPRYPDGREEWAAGLCGAMWTLEELRAGMAWRRLA